jgi:hypothetical protein
VLPATTSSYTPQHVALASRLAPKDAEARIAAMQADVAWRCPRVTPILFVPNLDPAAYLSIFSVGTDQTANTWNIAVYDSGADVTLCSEAFARANDLSFGGAKLPFNGAGGPPINTLGHLDSPLEFVLAANTPYACSAVAPVMVVEGTSHLYDLLISMEVIAQWTSHVNLQQHKLVYYPEHWLGGNSDVQNSLPMLVLNRTTPGSNETSPLQRPTPTAA